MSQSSKKLHEARKAKNDEFYTKIEDIDKELSRWKDKLAGKRIICPCDSKDSNFVKYLEEKKDIWKIKSIDYSAWPNRFQDIDYSKYDICITNPPFSQYYDAVKYIFGKIDFIMMASFINRARVSIIELINKKEVYLGYGRHLALSWTNTDKKVAIDWLTSFSDAQDYYDTIKPQLPEGEYSIAVFDKINYKLNSFELHPGKKNKFSWVDVKIIS